MHLQQQGVWKQELRRVWRLQRDDMPAYDVTGAADAILHNNITNKTYKHFEKEADSCLILVSGLAG